MKYRIDLISKIYSIENQFIFGKKLTSFDINVAFPSPSGGT